MARQACRRQLAIIKGGYQGSKHLFRSEVLSFWEKYGIKPKKNWYDLYCYKDKESIIPAIFLKTFTGKKNHNKQA